MNKIKLLLFLTASSCLVLPAQSQQVDVNFHIDKTYSVSKDFHQISGFSNAASFTELTQRGLRSYGATESPVLKSRLTNDDGRAIKITEADTASTQGTLGYMKFSTLVKVKARQAITVLHTFQIYVNRQVSTDSQINKPYDDSAIELFHYGDHDLTEQIPGFNLSGSSVSNFYYTSSRIHTNTYSNRDARFITVKATYRNASNEDKEIPSHFGLLVFTKGNCGYGHCLEGAIIHKGSNQIECFDPKIISGETKVLREENEFKEGIYTFDDMYNRRMTPDPGSRRSKLSYVGDTCIQMQEYNAAVSNHYFYKGFTSLFTKAMLSLTVPAHTTYAICYNFSLKDYQSSNQTAYHSAEFFAVGQEESNFDKLNLLVDWKTDPISHKKLQRSDSTTVSRICTSASNNWAVDTTRQVIQYINDSDKDSTITNYFGIFQYAGNALGNHRQTVKLEILNWYEVANVRNAATTSIGNGDDKDFLTRQDGADLYVSEQTKNSDKTGSQTCFELCNTIDANTSKVFRYSVDMGMKDAVKGASVRIYTEDPTKKQSSPAAVLEVQDEGSNTGRRFFSLTFINNDTILSTVSQKIYMVAECPSGQEHQYQASLKFGAIEKQKQDSTNVNFILNSSNCYSGSDKDFYKNRNTKRNVASVPADSCTASSFSMQQPSEFNGALYTYTPFSVSVTVPAKTTKYYLHTFEVWQKQAGAISANAANAVTELFAYGATDKSDAVKFHLEGDSKRSSERYSFGRIRQQDPGWVSNRKIRIYEAYENDSSEPRIITHYFGMLNVQPGGNSHTLESGVRLLYTESGLEPGTCYMESLNELYGACDDKYTNYWGNLSEWKELERGNAVYNNTSNILYDYNGNGVLIRADLAGFIEHQADDTRRLYQKYTSACYVPAHSEVIVDETVVIQGEERRNNSSPYYGEVFYFGDEDATKQVYSANYDEKSGFLSSMLYSICRFSVRTNPSACLPYQKNIVQAKTLPIHYINYSDEPCIIRKHWGVMLVAPDEPSSFGNFVKKLFGKNEGHQIEWTIARQSACDKTVKIIPAVSSYTPVVCGTVKEGSLSANTVSELRDASANRGYQFISAPERNDGYYYLDQCGSGKLLYAPIKATHTVQPHSTDTLFYKVDITSHDVKGRLLVFDSNNPAEQQLRQTTSSSTVDINWKDYNAGTGIDETRTYILPMIFKNISDEVKTFDKTVAFVLHSGSARIKADGQEIRTTTKGGYNFRICKGEATLLPATGGKYIITPLLPALVGKYTNEQILHIPDSIDYRGAVYPVSTLGTGSLAGIDLKDYSIPPFITKIEPGAITGTTLRTLRIPYGEKILCFGSNISQTQDKDNIPYTIYHDAIGTDCPNLKKVYVARTLSQDNWNDLCKCGPFAVQVEHKCSEDWPDYYYTFHSPVDSVFFEFGTRTHTDSIGIDTLLYSVGYRSFSGCSNTEFVFPEKLRFSTVGSFGFENCDNLTSFDFRMCDFYLSGAFQNANNGLNHVVVTPNVKSIGSTALACNIKTLVIEDADSALIIQPGDRFSWWGRDARRPNGDAYKAMLDTLRCNRDFLIDMTIYRTSLTKFFNPTTSGAPFSYCLLEPDNSGLRYQLGGSMHTILEGMFVDNEVEYFNVPDNIFRINDDAMGMPKLRRIDIGRNVSYIGNHAFMRQEMGINQTWASEKIKIGTKSGVLKSIFSCIFGDAYMDLHDAQKNTWNTYKEYNTKMDTIVCLADAHIQQTPESVVGCFGEYTYDNTLLIHTSPDLIEKYPWNMFKHHKLQWEMSEYQTEFSCCYDDHNETKLHTEDCDVLLQNTIRTGWNTICLPFDVRVSELCEQLGSNTRVFGMSSLKYDNRSRQFKVNFRQIAEADSLTANTPYMLYSDYSVPVLFFRDRVVQIRHDAEPDVTVTDKQTGASVTMRGNYSFGYSPLQSTILADNLFHKVDNFTLIPAFHAYFITDDGKEDTRGAVFAPVFHSGEEESAEDNGSDNAIWKSGYFDLMGREIDRPQNGQFYIHDNRTNIHF